MRTEELAQIAALVESGEPLDLTTARRLVTEVPLCAPLKAEQGRDCGPSPAPRPPRYATLTPTGGSER